MHHVHHWQSTKRIYPPDYILAHLSVQCEVCGQLAILHCRVELWEPIVEGGLAIDCPDMAGCISNIKEKEEASHVSS